MSNVFKAFILCVLLITFGNDDSFASTTCEPIELRNTKEYLNANTICLSTFNNRNVGRIPISDGDILYAENIVNLDISSETIGNSLQGKKFALVISGVCAGKCSRLIAPLSSRIEFRDHGMLILSDASIPTRAQKFKDYLLSNPISSTNSHSEFYADIGDNLDSTNDRLLKSYGIELEMLDAAGVEITHLLWHSFVYRSYAASVSKNCYPINKPVVVVLNYDYIIENGMYSPKEKFLPDTKKIISEVKENFGESVIYISYGSKPIYGCY